MRYDFAVGLWSWLFGEAAPPRPPAWSTFEDAAAFARFVEVVRATLTARGRDVDPAMIRSGTVMLATGDRRREWILHRLAERCAAAPEDAWAEMIDAAAGRFLGDAMNDEDAPPPAEKKRKKRRAQGRGGGDRLRMDPPLEPAHLRVQLMSSAYLAPVDRASLVSRTCAPGIEQVLVALLPGSEITLGPADVAGLGLSVDEAWQRASDNALASDLSGIVTTEVVAEGGAVVSLLVSNGFFMGACVLRMLDELEAEHVLVTLLTWHHAVLYVIEGTPSVAALRLMDELVSKLEAEVAVATAEWLSPTLFLWKRRAATLTPIELTRDADGRIVAVSPDPGFFP